MKFIYSLIIALSPFVLMSQNQFRLKSEIGLKDIQLNGRYYKIEEEYQSIKTNYPEFDTLVFDRTPIICNFKPDSSYSLIMACCGSTDIVYSKKYESVNQNNLDLEQDFAKIKMTLIDQPFLYLKLENYSKDSIYGWNSDGACEPVFSLLDTVSWKMGQPPKCYYWSNINYILFFKKDYRYHAINDRDDDIESFLEINGVHRLKSIAIRLFDKEHFEISYDVVTDEIFLKKKPVVEAK